MDKYEVTVIGYNLNALATAALLAKSGLQVLLLHDLSATEREKLLRTEMGFNSLFYSWDWSLGAMKFVLEKLEIGELDDNNDQGYIDTVITPYVELKRPFGWDAYRESLICCYPQEKEHLNFFFDEMEDLGKEWIVYLRSRSLAELQNIRKTIKYRNLTYSRFVEDLFKNVELLSILLSDLPHAQVSLPVMAGYLVTQVFDYHHLEGGYGRVCGLLHKTFLQAGGCIASTEKGFKVILDEGGGFLLKTQQRTVKSKNLVSTLDPLQTVLMYFPGWERAGFNGDEDPIPTSLFVKLWMAKEVDLKTLFAGDILHIISTVRTDDYLKKAERGESLPQNYRVYKEYQKNQLILQVDLPWTVRDGHYYPELVSEMKKTLCSFLPGGSRILEEEIITPEALERITGYTKGSFRRWAFRVGEMGVNPFDQRLPIEGLFTTGQWGSAWFTSAIAAW